MFHATRALAAALTLGAAACTFDHPGTQSGPASDRDASNEVDVGPDGDEDDASADQTRASEDAESGDESMDAPSDDAASEDGRGPLAEAQVDAGTADGIDSPVDGADANSKTDGGDSDSSETVDDSATVDAGPDTIPPRGCDTFPNAVAFTPPGARTPHCYWLHATVANWLTAANNCIAEGGHLLTLSSDAETTFARGIGPPMAASDHLWIGGTDGRFSGDGPGSGPFSWINGEPFTFTNWFGDAITQEPNGACESCNNGPCYCEHRVAMQRDGRWNDAYEAVLYRSLCEAEP